MAPSSTLSPRLIGQTEKALNAHLERLLDGSGLSEQQWVTLTLAASGDPGRLEGFAATVAAALKTGESQALDRIFELAAAGLLEPVVPGTPVRVSESGSRLHSRVRGASVELTGRLWGDLPAADLEAAARVLETVLARADAELAAAR